MNDIYDCLHTDLITCRLRPGEALREKDLCQRYGVSRTPLREALVALAGRGLVQLSPNKGAYASPVDQSALFSIYEVRIPLEKAAAALAALRADEDHLARLAVAEESLAACAEANDLDAYFPLDREIHALVIEAAANPVLENQIEILRQHTIRSWHYFKDRGVVEEIDVENLTAMIEAIHARDPKAAADAMFRHMRGYLKAYEEMLARPADVLGGI